MLPSLSHLLLLLTATIEPGTEALVRVFKVLPNREDILASQCIAAGGQLAVINNAVAQAKAVHAASIQSPSPYLRIRLGATVYKKGLGFEWVDGSRFGYTNWLPGRPDNFGKRGENCIEMALFPAEERGKWNDQLCDVIPMALCELTSPHKYRVMTNHMTSIAPLCFGNGGRLAVIRTDVDNRIALKVLLDDRKNDGLSGTSALVGGRRAPTYAVAMRRRKEFYWPTESIFSYTNWAEGEPNNEERLEECVEIQLDNYARWNDVPCAEPYLALCRLPSSANNTYRLVRNKAAPMHKLCFSLGGQLAVIRDETEQKTAATVIRDHYKMALKKLQEREDFDKLDNDFIRSFKINFQRVLLGARRFNDRCPQDLFAWTLDFQPMNYTNWLPGQPSKLPGEECVEMMKVSTGGWNDVKCYKPKLALCEYETMPEPPKYYRVIDEDGIDELRSYGFWEQQCRHRRGLFAKISNEEEQLLAEKAVRRLRLENEKILLGLTKTRYYPRYFAWLDNSRVGYDHWVNATRSDDDDCVEMVSSGPDLGRWRATGCRSKKALCEYKTRQAAFSKE